MQEASAKVSSSFRDPNGFLFYRNGTLYRQINMGYRENYEHLMNSGLYNSLTNNGLLIPHSDAEIPPEDEAVAFKIICPETIPFVSYPYEWCFTQLKDAALTTLLVQKSALSFGMSLKDASAYNIQFRNGKPLFIDTLSFEKYREGQPWIAYRQFCQHFLAPLALMSLTDIRLGQLSRIYIDGVPLDLTGALLPLRARFNFSLFSHIYLHSKSQKYFKDKDINRSHREMSKTSFIGIIDHLESAIDKLQWKANKKSEWADYYQGTTYSREAFEHKKQLVTKFLDYISPKSLWDFGANTGLFSRLASNKKINTISFDADLAAVEKNYLECRRKNESHILPLFLDLTNPSPSIGWQNQERVSLLERGTTDTALALALVHHLAIANNLPFTNIADFFNRICTFLIIEYVPKNDPQVTRMLSSRSDVFSNYKQYDFENEFQKYFIIQERCKVTESERILYLMKKR